MRVAPVANITSRSRPSATPEAFRPCAPALREKYHRSDSARHRASASAPCSASEAAALARRDRSVHQSHWRVSTPRSIELETLGDARGSTRGSRVRSAALDGRIFEEEPSAGPAPDGVSTRSTRMRLKISDQDSSAAKAIALRPWPQQREPSRNSAAAGT